MGMLFGGWLEDDFVSILPERDQKWIDSNVEYMQRKHPGKFNLNPTEPIQPMKDEPLSDKQLAFLRALNDLPVSKEP